MIAEATEQYIAALRSGRKYYRDAVASGKYPYPLVLEELIDPSFVSGYADLGVLEIPADAVIGTRYDSRKGALAGNFMPLMDADTEFASKWISLCDAHLGDEGIRDPIKCFEYLGKFYIQEGNKRFSVLKSYQAPGVAAHVTRVIPKYSEDPVIQSYYEFMHFYSLSGYYGITFEKGGEYKKLQEALGFASDHVWSEDERKSFNAAFSRFKDVFSKTVSPEKHINPSDALLVWLQVFSLQDIKELTAAELAGRIKTLTPDMVSQIERNGIQVYTRPEEKEQNVFSKVLTTIWPQPLKAAFIYPWRPEQSSWVQGHEEGRRYIEEKYSDQVITKAYLAPSGKEFEVIKEVAEAGYDVVFATASSMITACRKAAAIYKNVKFLNCAVFQPYTGVRMYNGRTYECKFVTGAIAGAMSKDSPIGYVANNPIFGTPASINAFALGAAMVNPSARIILDWTCLPGDPVERLKCAGVSVVSNRRIASAETASSSFDLGLFSISGEKGLTPLAAPFWNWGVMYERILQSIMSGAWNSLSGSKAVNYWWGMASGVLDIKLSDVLPEGVRFLAEILKDGIRSGRIDPFMRKICDQEGRLRCGEGTSLSPEEILSMDWLCDNVEGRIPGPEEILPDRLETVKILGLKRDEL